jgi:flavin reductase (DIM6/NTAB) family NADH-FMN oxidoreductase RutF
MALEKATEPSDIATRFKLALRGMASTVSVITAHDGARHHGMTATAVMSVSMEPPALVVCINQRTLLHDILNTARRFCVNILDETQEPVSAAFSGALPADERFEMGRWVYDSEGLGSLLDAQASVVCRKVAAMPYGTHTLFIGEVADVRFAERQSPLLYLNAGYCTHLPNAAHA